MSRAQNCIFDQYYSSSDPEERGQVPVRERQNHCTSRQDDQYDSSSQYSLNPHNTNLPLRKVFSSKRHRLLSCNLFTLIILLVIFSQHVQHFSVNATTCQSIDALSDSVCSSHGACISTDRCLCHMGYYGSDCSGFLSANRPTVTMYGLGQNSESQLQGSTTYALDKMNSTLASDEMVLFSSVGQQHNSYFTNRNTTYSWGFASRTGLGAAENVVSPQRITELDGLYITYMDSYIHTVIVTAENQIKGWGKNSDRQLDSSGTDRLTPVSMVSGEMGSNRVVGLACGTFITIFLDETGAVYTQGTNANGKTYYLGISALGAGAVQPTPRRVSNLDSKIVFSITAGEESAHVVTTDNLVYSWGNGPVTGTTSTDAVNVPTLISMDNIGGGEKVEQVCDGLEHGLLRTDAGFVYSWGVTFQGALGQGDGTFYSLPPAKVSGGSLAGKFVNDIACAGYMSVALDSLGNVHRWGRAASSAALAQTSLPILVSLLYDGFSILNHSFIAKVETGQGHILVDSYKIPTCFEGEWFYGEACAGRGSCIADDVCQCNSGYDGPQCEFFLCYGYNSNETDSVCSNHGDCVAPATCTCNTGYDGPDCSLSICHNVLSNDSSVCSTYGNCTSPDTCECQTGYYGDDCRYWNCSSVESKESNVCSSHGTCLTPDVCSCSSGYLGDNCELIQCFDYLSNMTEVCTSRGDCVSPNDCSCQTGYAGPECEYNTCYGINSNETSVCSSFGNCTAPDTCRCESGYSGSNCELFICYTVVSNATLVCSGSGSCVDVDSCSCNTGYGGSNCEFNICSGILSNESSVCSSHGNCSAPNTCICSTGHTGDDCQLNICFDILSNATDVCSAHGSCDSPDTCSCSTGYAGSNCSLSVCFGINSNESSACTSRGQCVAPESCICDSGFSGSECEYNICFSVNSNETAVCSSHGNCTFPDTCACETGYGGSNCEYFRCFDILANETQVCNAHGSCTGIDTCSCSSGYGGDECQFNVCGGIMSNESSVCASNGNCSAPNTCDCFTGYEGELCELNLCFDILSNESAVCNTHGSCNSPDTCSCSTGYAGTSCELSVCFNVWSNNASACNTHGNCTAPDICSCSTGYYGSNCQLSQCHGVLSNESNVCSNRGQCIDVDTCSCNIGYAGSNCELSYCFDILSNESTVCSGQGDCLSLDTCSCNMGYSGSDCALIVCFGTLNNQSTVCSSHGNCSAPSQCDCSTGYSGGNCELNICFGIISNESAVCNMHGSCDSPDSCSCSTGYVGSSCELNICNSIYSNESTVCSSRGNCTEPSVCVCETGYAGSDCELNVCNSILSNESAVCSGHGLCIERNTCSCVTGYAGSECELSICSGIVSNESSVCSFRGSCDAPESCLCNTGYNGTNCELVSCFNVLSNDDAVCSGFGNCTAPDVCSCDPGYYSALCNIPECHGYFANDSRVCSTHGDCALFETCRCQNGYKGSNCELSECFGSLSNDSSVCSSHGSCVSPDSCSCSTGYAGSSCNLNICHDILSNESSVCRSRGSCDAPDSCSCSSGYAGDECELFVCFNILSNESTTCSSHGVCTGPDTCLCAFNNATGFYDGNDCSSCDSFYTGVNCLDKYCNATTSCSAHGVCNADAGCDCDRGYTGRSCSVCVNPFSTFPNCVICSNATTCNSRGLCTENETCACHQSETLGYFNGSTCSSCSSGWSGSTCRIFLPQQFQLSDDGTKLVTEYVDSDYSRPASVPCSRLFASDSLVALGTGAICIWSDASTQFEVRLSSSATILPDDSLRVALTPGDSSTLFKNVIILAPINPESPNAALTVPDLVGLCMDVNLDASGSSSSSPRSLLYTFTSSEPIFNPSLFPPSASEIRAISEDVIAALGTQTTVTFSVRVNTFFGASSNMSKDVIFVPQSVPLVEIVGTQNLVISPRTALTFTARAVSSCDSTPFDETKMTYSWTQIAGPEVVADLSLTNNNQKLTLSSGVPQQGTYVFRFSGKHDDLPVASTVDVTIVGKFRDLVAIIEGGNRIVPSNRNLTLDGSSSYDPDEVHSADMYLYQWTCFDIIEQDTCIFALGSSPTVNIPSATLVSGGHYRFTLNFSSVERFSLTTVTWSAEEGQLVFVSLKSLSTYISPTKNLELEVNVEVDRSSGFVPIADDDPQVSYAWFMSIDLSAETEITSTQALTNTNQRSIILDASYLKPGARHIFRVQVTVADLAQSGTASVSTIVNLPPQNGALVVSPSVGYAATTRFSLFTSGWTDTDLPLQYQFFYSHPTTKARSSISPLSASLSMSHVTFPTFSFTENITLEVGVTAYDILGASTFITKNITILATSSSRNETLIRTEKDIEDVGDIIGLADLTTILRTLLEIAQSLLSHESLYCSTECSSKGECIIRGESYQVCVCERGAAGQDCSSTSDIKVRAETLKAATLSVMVSTLSRDEYTDWTDEDTDLITEILSTLVFDQDEISEEMISLSLPVIHAVSSKTPSVSDETIMGRLMETLSKLDGKALESEDACTLSKFVALPTVQQNSSTLPSRILFENILSLMSSQMQDGQAPIVREYSYAVFYVQKDAFEEFRGATGGGGYNDGAQYFGKHAGIVLPPLLLNQIVTQPVDMQFMSVIKSPFTCDSRPENSEYQSHTVMLRFLHSTGAKIAVANLEEPIEITIPGDFSVPEDTLQRKHELVCRYFDEDSEEWSRDGCTMKTFSSNRTVCECTHTTYFSVFLEYTDLDVDVAQLNWIIPVILGSIAALCLIAGCCCFLCILCFVFACLLGGIRRRKQIRKRKYAVDPNCGRGLIKGESTMSLKSDFSLHPWDYENRGLPYFMRKYEATAGEDNPNEATTSDDDESSMMGNGVKVFSSLDDNGFPLFEKAIPIKVQSKKHGSDGGGDVADPKLPSDDESDVALGSTRRHSMRSTDSLEPNETSLVEAFIADEDEENHSGSGSNVSEEGSRFLTVTPVREALRLTPLLARSMNHQQNKDPSLSL
mmetsp:Transcript_5791/g.21868  ORF Transcript_5791/g.21868 Transcript_5791/m.21868 type:complete len:2954 (-) Transcript_5791:68-8929(-)